MHYATATLPRDNEEGLLHPEFLVPWLSFF